MRVKFIIRKNNIRENELPEKGGFYNFHLMLQVGEILAFYDLFSLNEMFSHPRNERLVGYMLSE